MNGSPAIRRNRTAYDYLLKFLLVGDSDVGKGEILGRLDDSASDITFGTYTSVNGKLFSIL